MRTDRPALSTIAAVAAIALLAGCGQEDSPGSTAPDQTTPAPSATPTTSATPSPTDLPQPVVDQAIALLADQLGVTPDQIEVVSAIEVTWPDGSIGCPKKGMGYTQALVPGSLVKLMVDGTTYQFHQDQTKPPFYCAKPTDPVPTS